MNRQIQSDLWSWRDVTPDEPMIEVSLVVNGEPFEREVPARMLLVHLIRDEFGLTGTKVGCETSACGCCTVLMDGKQVKSCTLLAAQSDGREIVTIEGDDGAKELDDIQQAFSEHHALQCGYCTPGMVMSVRGLLAQNSQPERDEIKKGIAGNLCRCTGYEFILDAVQSVVDRRNE